MFIYGRDEERIAWGLMWIEARGERPDVLRDRFEGFSLDVHDRFFQRISLVETYSIYRYWSCRVDEKHRVG